MSVATTPIVAFDAWDFGVGFALRRVPIIKVRPAEVRMKVRYEAF
jgi:hypothetical protein